MTPATDLFIDGPAGKLSVRTKGLEAKPAHVVILVQGANLSGQLGYDFSFAGRSDYSMMEALVERGFARSRRADGSLRVCIAANHSQKPTFRLRAHSLSVRTQ